MPRTYTGNAMKPPRERAARALCDLKGLPQNSRFEGGAMWESFLPEVDAVLSAALTAEQLATLNAKNPATR